MLFRSNLAAELRYLLLGERRALRTHQIVRDLVLLHRLVGGECLLFHVVELGLQLGADIMGLAVLRVRLRLDVLLGILAALLLQLFFRHSDTDLPSQD